MSGAVFRWPSYGRVVTFRRRRTLQLSPPSKPGNKMGRKRYLEGDLCGRLGLIDSTAAGHNARLRFQTHLC